MIRSFAQDKPPLQILSERENIYRLLSGTSAENLQKDHAKYTINPSSRYLQITHKKVREVYHLFDTDDAVNADFSLGSPATDANDKGKTRVQDAILTFWQLFQSGAMWKKSEKIEFHAFVGSKQFIQAEWLEK